MFTPAGRAGGTSEIDEARWLPVASRRSLDRSRLERRPAGSSIAQRANPMSHLSMAAAAVESVAVHGLSLPVEHLRDKGTMSRMRLPVGADAVPQVQGVVGARRVVRAR